MDADSLAALEERLAVMLAVERARAGDQRLVVLRAMAADDRAAFSEAVRASDRARAQEIWATVAQGVNTTNERGT